MYQIILSKETFEKIAQYQAAITDGRKTPGDRLHPLLSAGMSTEEFIEALLATKQPRIFAESEIVGDGSDWTQDELAILGDINVAMAVKIFDNGVWDPTHPDFREYATPLNGHLLFTPGALLTKNSPDHSEVVTAGKIDQKKYNQLVERRLLPLLVHANETAKSKGKPALITLPGIGCGAFAGKFKGTVAAHLNTALKAMLDKHGDKLDHIACVYFDPFAECGNEQKDIHGIKYRVRPATLNPGKPQLSPPLHFQETGDDFSGCTLYKIVAWDHVSLPGNDFFADSRFTDDGVSAAATNSMEVMTGVAGEYRDGQYNPPKGYATWEDVAIKKGVRLAVTRNLRITKPAAPKP